MINTTTNTITTTALPFITDFVFALIADVIDEEALADPSDVCFVVLLIVEEVELPRSIISAITALTSDDALLSNIELIVISARASAFCSFNCEKETFAVLFLITTLPP